MTPRAPKSRKPTVGELVRAVAFFVVCLVIIGVGIRNSVRRHQVAAVVAGQAVGRGTPDQPQVVLTWDPTRSTGSTAVTTEAETVARAATKLWQNTAPYKGAPHATGALLGAGQPVMVTAYMNANLDAQYAPQGIPILDLVISSPVSLAGHAANWYAQAFVSLLMLSTFADEADCPQASQLRCMTYPDIANGWDGVDTAISLVDPDGRQIELVTAATPESSETILGVGLVRGAVPSSVWDITTPHVAFSANADTPQGQAALAATQQFAYASSHSGEILAKMLASQPSPATAATG